MRGSWNRQGYARRAPPTSAAATGGRDGGETAFRPSRPLGAGDRRLARPGLQIAETLVELGARVALVARKADELDAAVAHLAATFGADAVPLVCDLSDVRAVAPVVERAVAALGPIDILVNNAGTTWGAATVEHPLEAWQKVVNLNLTATFLVTQEVGKRCMLPRRRGKVINIASILGLVGAANRTAPRRSPTTPARAGS
jgi:NAD(P)-dependent dehydrogenase (short-subunit alcohol dehydrogenase family)